MAGIDAASLESRITLPEDKKIESGTSPNENPIPTKADKDATETASPPIAPSSSWADDISSPVQADLPPYKETDKPTQPTQLGQAPTPVMDQTDGASEARSGSVGIYEPNFEVDVKLADAQADPKNPLFSIKSFEELGLDENILRGIYQMRFTKPSKIQEKALPLLLRNPPSNMIGQSQSGTGKTAAFVLNILSRIDLKDPAKRQVPQALVLAPTRELARQIIGVVQLMGSFLEGLRVLPAIPMDIQNRGRNLEGQIVVGTPGTVMDLVRKRLLRADQIQVLVLDEADNMLDQQGLGDQCIRVKG